MLEKAKKKFDNKVLEHIAQQISINQAKLFAALTSIESSYSSISSFFVRICNVTKFSKEIKDRMNKIDEDLKASAQNLQHEPSSSSAHHMAIRLLSGKQNDLLEEGARIRTTLSDIQNMILPIMDTMQKHIAHSKALIHDNQFSIADHMIELSIEVQVALHTCKILQENWDRTLAQINKVHSSFLSHFGISI